MKIPTKEQLQEWYESVKDHAEYSSTSQTMLMLLDYIEVLERALVIACHQMVACESEDCAKHREAEKAYARDAVEDATKEIEAERKQK